MSNREPLWFCHQCSAEMRPLMVPDPVCASCHGSFVEKMDDVTSDDPRQFQTTGPLHEFGDETAPPGVENFLMSLQSLMSGGSPDRATGGRTRSPDRHPSPPIGGGSNFTIQIRNSRGQPRTWSFGSGRPQTEGPPTMSEFTRGSPGGPGTITGPLMAQYLMSMLGHRDPFSDLFAGGSDGPGRLGDYVFNQQALDEIITQLMDSSNAGRPVPATEDIMDNLPREVLEVGSPMLDKDCAVCKEQFKADSEDPEEQVVVTLPCKHPFHESCIMPWLKSSGTCPVCRHALVPQPEHHPPPMDSGGGGSNSSNSSSSRSRPSSPSTSRGSGSDFFSAIFGSFGGGGGSSSTSNGGRPEPSRRQSRSGNNDRHHNVPGGWSDELD